MSFILCVSSLDLSLWRHRSFAPLLPWEERNFSLLPSSLPLFSSFLSLLRLYPPSLWLELPLLRLSITFGNLSEELVSSSTLFSSSSFPFFHGSTPAGSSNLLFEVFRFGFFKTRSTHFRKIPLLPASFPSDHHAPACVPHALLRW